MKILTETIQYAGGVFFREGNRVYCSSKIPPTGLDVIEDSYELVPDKFRSLLKEPKDAHSWAVRGWAETVSQKDPQESGS